MMAKFASSIVLADAPRASGMSPAETDERFVAALVDGDPAVQRLAFLRLAPVVRRVLSRTFGPTQEREDILQEVFLCFFSRVHTLLYAGALKAFVVAITIRKCREHLRRARTRSFVRLWTFEDPPEPSVHADTAARQALIHFYRVLDHLGDRDRMAFVLRFIEGMEAAEVAASLRVSVATARRCSRRAWRRVTMLASNDPFLAEYVTRVQVSHATKSP
jgi:RNA polymerase sigma-70 factor, ECF subfamily